MTTHVINELKSTLSQEFTIIKRREIIAIRPKLLFVDDPAGEFIITLKQGATTLGSASLTMTEILDGTGWVANRYHYGFLRFQFAAPIILNRGLTYTIELSSSGYTYSSSSYLGWIQEYYNPINQGDGSTLLTDFERPYSYQLWSGI